jgi:hypothetical protein
MPSANTGKTTATQVGLCRLGRLLPRAVSWGRAMQATGLRPSGLAHGRRWPSRQGPGPEDRGVPIGVC